MKKIIIILLVTLCSMLFTSCVSVDSQAEMKYAPSEIKSIEIYNYKENSNDESAELLICIPTDQFQQFCNEFNSLPCCKEIWFFPVSLSPADVLGYVVVVTPIDGYKEYYSKYSASSRGVKYFDAEVWNIFIEKYVGNGI